jgi:D-alanyl-D-alanine carboxypeptidase/D-alanyl-D-alanine-endopeptidase (penicillin-binding protein 4)
VKVEGSIRRGRVEGATDLLAYRSGLERTLKVMLTNSQNLYAECLFKRIGDGTFAGGGAAVKKALDDLGIDTEGLVASDGSGLARANRTSARTLYETLQAFRDEPLFTGALAAGGEGTLRRRYKDLGDRLRAKTGTIRGVSTFSGYLTSATGERYVFVLLANGRSTAHARRLQDLLVETLR